MSNAATCTITKFVRPRIERAPDGPGYLVHRGSHAWLCGDRRQALAEFALLERIERTGSYRRTKGGAG